MKYIKVLKSKKVDLEVLVSYTSFSKLKAIMKDCEGATVSLHSTESSNYCHKHQDQAIVVFACKNKWGGKPGGFFFSECIGFNLAKVTNNSKRQFLPTISESV